MKTPDQMDMGSPKTPEVKENEAERGLETLNKMEALKNALDNLKASLSKEGLLEFIQYYRMLPHLKDVDSSRKLLNGLGNHQFDGYSDQKLVEKNLKDFHLDNYQEKEKRFDELMNRGPIGEKSFKELEQAGFNDDAILDALLEPARLSALLATFEAIQRNLPLEKK